MKDRKHTRRRVLSIIGAAGTFPITASSVAAGESPSKRVCIVEMGLSDGEIKLLKSSNGISVTELPNLDKYKVKSSKKLFEKTKKKKGKREDMIKNSRKKAKKQQNESKAGGE